MRCKECLADLDETNNLLVEDDYICDNCQIEEWERENEQLKREYMKNAL